MLASNSVPFVEGISRFMFLRRMFEKLVIDRPVPALIVLLCVIGFFLSQIPKFKLDASSESLVLENDEDLSYYRQIAKAYASSDFLIITWAPFDDLMSDRSLDGLKALRDDLKKIANVESVVTMLDVPLLDSPRVSFSDLKDGLKTLEDKGVDRNLARKEFTTSPIYSNLLVSLDGKTTALQVNLKRDETFFDLLNKRNQLRDKKNTVGLTAEEAVAFGKAQSAFKAHLALVQNKLTKDIQFIRGLMDKYRDRAQLFLGGVPMITSDIIDFIGSDLVVFGLGVFLFMVIALWFFFRKLRWVLLPLLCCGLTALGMIGFLGLIDWRVTVISSNFVSILLIVTMQLTIHLIVRYGELHALDKEGKQKAKVIETVRLMVQPCFYTAVTTIAAFSSLVVSGIRPVIDFGWMMTIGICFGFITSFILWPALLMLMRPVDAVSDHDRTHAFTIGIAHLTQKHGNKVLALGAVLAVWSLTGITQLKVDNRFIDYFKESTEIYQGMEVIDRELGGTTPMEIILEPDATHFKYLGDLKKQQNAPAPEDGDEFEDPFGNGVEEDPFEDPFDDPFGDGSGQQENYDDETNFWFHEDQLEEIERIHAFLESLPEIGKVQSLATFSKILKLLNDGEPLEDYDLQVVRKLATDAVKEGLLYPYMSNDGSQARITMRIVEAHPGLHRKALVEKIEQFLEQDMAYPRERFRVTGMAILYNNMLYSLYDSQITTLGMVFAAILVMFIILFRNVLLAVLAMPPTVLAAGLILGLMGWLGIPLDMMTITIASITIGIGVDDTIHYIHRFQEEFKKDGDYSACVVRCHGSIGRALYYTSVVVTFGFSILAMSNFIPTIYFGLLTGLAMVLALVNNLTLLPMLIVVFKPLGQPRSSQSA